MQGLPVGVLAYNEDPYNVGGVAVWYCEYRSRAEAEGILERSFPEIPRGRFSPVASEPGQNRARVIWRFNEQEFFGDVLVDTKLNPVGFIAEVHLGFMVFNLNGEHIPYPRFASGTPDTESTGVEPVDRN